MLLFCQLAKQYHPDQNKTPGAKEKFVEIQDAYDVSTAAALSRAGSSDDAIELTFATDAVTFPGPL